MTRILRTPAWRAAGAVAAQWPRSSSRRTNPGRIDIPFEKNCAGLDAIALDGEIYDTDPKKKAIVAARRHAIGAGMKVSPSGVGDADHRGVS
jgi:hypothetical protein